MLTRLFFFSFFPHAPTFLLFCLIFVIALLQFLAHIFSGVCISGRSRHELSVRFCEKMNGSKDNFVGDKIQCIFLSNGNT